MFTLFISVQLITGATWDEDLHRYGYYEITSFAYDVLNGNFSRDFETIYADLEYYGLIPIFPAAWLTDIIAQLFKLDQMQSGTVFRWLLHFTGLLWGTGTVVLVYHILKRLTENTKIALLGSAFLMLYPTWLGHSFFNYKDLALGFFYTLALYGAFKAYSEDPKAYKDGVIILVVATIGAATTKLVGAPLLIVQWICVFLAALKLGPVQARLKALTLAGLITVIGTYVLTPAAWLEPIRFVIESISYMSYHEWAGCTLTDGICLRPSAEDWSAMTYLSGWLGARWPLLLLVTIVPTSLYLAWRGKTLERILLAAAFLPLLLIAARDSALYTGIRHLLFIMPALICCMFVAGHQITQNHTRIRKGASALLFASMAMFVVDNVQLYPYNYVYFNEVGRIRTDARSHELDYWGLSLRKSAKHLNTKMTEDAELPKTYYAAPLHLISPLMEPKLEGIDGHRADTPETAYLWIGYTKNNRAPDQNCIISSQVTRRLVFAQSDLVLSTVAVCPGKDVS